MRMFQHRSFSLIQQAIPYAPGRELAVSQAHVAVLLKPLVLTLELLDFGACGVASLIILQARLAGLHDGLEPLVVDVGVDALSPAGRVHRLVATDAFHEDPDLLLGCVPATGGLAYPADQLPGRTRIGIGLVFMLGLQITHAPVLLVVAKPNFNGDTHRRILRWATPTSPTPASPTCLLTIGVEVRCGKNGCRSLGDKVYTSQGDRDTD